jgi:3-hydroxyisobutyrate dehydrogenase-like beta-hydroxyacid dehydrogenase
MDKNKIIGWIGLGKMGIPMSMNLIKAGYALVVYDMVQDSVNALASRSARSAHSPEGVAKESDVVFSMISDDNALKDITLGAKGVFRGMKPGTIFVDMSTVSPSISREVAEKGKNKHVKYLRAPVSGSTLFAQEGILTILCSGPKDAYDACIDLFNVMGKKVFYIGKSEEARYLKLLLNMMVATTSAMTAEALTFGELGGIRWDQMIDVINNSAVAAPQIGFKAQMLKDRDFTPAFSVAQMAKDLDIALNTGGDLNAPMPITSLVRQFLGMMMAQGRGDNDFFALVSLLEELGGFKEHKEG